MVRQSGARPAGATDLLQLSPASLAQVAYDERYRALVRWRCSAAPGRWSALRMSKAWTASSIRSSPASTRNGEIGPSKPLHKPFDITGNAKIVALRPCLGYPIRVAIVKKETLPTASNRTTERQSLCLSRRYRRRLTAVRVTISNLPETMPSESSTRQWQHLTRISNLIQTSRPSGGLERLYS